MKPSLADFSQRLKGFKGMLAVLAVLALSAAAGAGLSHNWVVFGQDEQRAQRPLPSPNDLSRAFIDVAKRVEPAVVNISVTSVTEKGSEGMDVPEGLRKLFPQLGPQGPRAERIGGSGVIISPDGYILTNNHVASSGESIYVTLADGTTRLKATKVGTDPETDLAVIKVPGHNLPFAQLGNSDDVQQGQWVVAIGSPFGLPQTMTAGIVSAVGRNLPGSATSTYDYYIQTDASINPGNSGGPLVDMDGKVIGINTLIFTSSGGNQGIGFAIPSSLANKVYAQLVKFGKVERGYLGVYLQPVSRSYAESMGLQNSNGALVADLPNQNTPAARAGLKSGDVIVEVDGKAVKSSKELTEMVAEEPIGKTVPVKYIRDGKVETTSLKIAERPDVNGQTLAERGTEGNPSGKLGLTVENLTPEIAQQLNLKINNGVVIDDVAPGSPADDAGLQKGTVIHRIDRTRVLNKTDLYRALRQLGNAKEVTLQVEQQGSDGMHRAVVTLNLD